MLVQNMLKTPTDTFFVCPNSLNISGWGLEHLDYLSIQLGIIIPTDEVIFVRGVGQPPTRDDG
jgi:hypothetical protein